VIGYNKAVFKGFNENQNLIPLLAHLLLMYQVSTDQRRFGALQHRTKASHCAPRSRMPFLFFEFQIFLKEIEDG
jgi:hypothetical protein